MHSLRFRIYEALFLLPSIFVEAFLRVDTSTIVYMIASHVSSFCLLAADRFTITDTT